MATELKRMRQLIGTTADWGVNDLIIGDGEIAVETTALGHVIKVGDGVKRYSELPQSGYVLKTGDAITGSLTVDGNLGAGTRNPAAYGRLAVVGGAFDFFANPGAAGVRTEIGSVGAQPLALMCGGVEALRINSAGETHVGEVTKGTINDGGFAFLPGAAAQFSIGHKAAVADGAHFAVFFYNGAGIGTITQSGGGTAVTYATTSDYRLKTIDGPVADPAAFIAALRPVRGRWKHNGEPFVGFVAHEFAQVSPSSVTGQKDATDKDGAPAYQAMQAATSEVMANVIAELQALRAELTALRAPA